MESPPLLACSGVVRRFGAVTALAGVDLVVQAGEVVLLLGSNGAGKTTLLRVMAGLTRPVRGTARVMGHDVWADPTARRLIGFVSHHALMYEDLTPRENLRFTAALHELDDAPSRITSALATAGLASRADAPARGFSRGMLQRLALARATLHDPPLLLLDEPFTGLDADATGQLSERIGASGPGRAIVAVSHDPAELWALATRVVVLSAGRVIADEPRPADLDAFRLRLAARHAA